MHCILFLLLLLTCSVLRSDALTNPYILGSISQPAAAGPAAAVTRTTTGTGTGNLDITRTDFGTPNAALVLFTGSTADGTAATHRRWGIGCADGTNQWVITTASEDGLTGATDAYRRQTTTQLLISLDMTGAVEGEAAFSAWITDGIRLNITDAFPSSYFVTALLFRGVSNFKCDTFITADAVDGTTDVTTIGFQADFLWLASITDDSDDVSEISATLSMGMVLGNGTQRAFGMNDNDAQATTDLDGIYNTHGITFQSTGGGAAGAVEIGSFDSSGFTATTRLAVNPAQCGSGCKVYVAAFKWPGGFTHALAQNSSPTGTGTQSVTFPAFQPDLGVAFLNYVGSGTSAGTVDASDVDSGGVSVLTTDAQFCNVWMADDGAGVSDTHSLSDNQAVLLPDGGNSGGFAGTFSGFTANGWDWSFSAVSGDAKRWILYALQF